MTYLIDVMALLVETLESPSAAQAGSVASTSLHNMSMYIAKGLVGNLTPPANVFPPECAPPLGSSCPCFGLSRVVSCGSNCMSSCFFFIAVLESVACVRSLCLIRSTARRSMMLIRTGAFEGSHQASLQSRHDTRRNQRHCAGYRLGHHPGKLAYGELWQSAL